jgi:hypothetical protein
MIEELWKKIREIDKWPETEAVVSSILRVPSARRRGAVTIVVFRYKTPDGTVLAGKFRAGKYSSLFDISSGDTFALRYNPRNPSRYWSDAYGLPVGTGLFVIWAFAVLIILALVLNSQ